MPRVGFELTTLVFERAKTVHALDRPATVIGNGDGGGGGGGGNVSSFIVIQARSLKKLLKI
jgi:hypothetical protein